MPYSLEFPVTKFTTRSHNYHGTEIVYRFYEDIPYVANPVDIKYQTLNVKVPVSVDGKALDASHAPIFFGIGCAGGLSTTASSGGAFGPPPGEGGPGEPPGGPGGPAPKKISELSGEEWESLVGGAGHEGGGIVMMGMPVLGGQTLLPQEMPNMGDEPAPPDGSRWEKIKHGYIIVEVGCRGRENQWPDGTYYGKYPAAIVDLKAAVRYIRHNAGRFPGDPEKIIATGGSGGAWMSTLLAASGNCALFEPMLDVLGAAKERDDIFVTYSTSPIIDHDHVDGALEWQGGALLHDPVSIERSQELQGIFRDYLEEYQFIGQNGYGHLTADNLGEYILNEYLIPDATRYLERMETPQREDYLRLRPWIHYDGKTASFSFTDFGLYAPRSANVPYFDDLAMEQPQPNGYGDAHIAAQHYTDFALRLATGNPNVRVEQSIKDRVNLVNPIWHIHQRHSDIAPYWWIRHGACDPCTAIAPAVLLAVSAESAGKYVNARLVWDGGHCADDDQEDFLTWIGEITEYHPFCV